MAAAAIAHVPPPSFHSLEALLTPLTKEAVGSLFSALDANGDGRLSVEDFANPVTHEVSQAALAQWRRVHAEAKGSAAAAAACAGAGVPSPPAPASSSAGSVELWELQRYFLRAAEVHAHASPAIQALVNGHVRRVGRDIANMLNLRVGVDAQKKRSRSECESEGAAAAAADAGGGGGGAEAAAGGEKRHRVTTTTAAAAAAAAATATAVAAAAASSAAVQAAASAAAGVGEHMHALVQLDGDSRRAVTRLFAQLDKTGDGVIALDDFADEEGVSAEMHALFGELRALFAVAGGGGGAAAASIRQTDFLRFFLRQGVLFLQSDPDCALAVNGAVQDAVAAFYEATARPLDVEVAARSGAADVEDVRGGFGNLRVASAVGSEVSALDSFEYAVDDAPDGGGGGEGGAQAQ